MFVLEGMYIAPDGLESEKITIGVDDTSEGYCCRSTELWHVAIQAFRETFAKMGFEEEAFPTRSKGETPNA